MSVINVRKWWLGIAVAAHLFCPFVEAIPVSVLAWDEDVAARQLAIKDVNGSKVIESMHPSQRTKPLQVKMAGKSLVVEALDRKSPEGKPLTCEVAVPEGVKQPLILVIADSTTPTGVRLFLLDDAVSRFGWGCFRFINATEKSLLLGYEKETLELPASWDPVLVKPGGETRNMEIKLFFQEEPAKPFYSGIWEMNANQRLLAILAPTGTDGQGPIEIKLIPEERGIVEAVKGKSGKSK